METSYKVLILIHIFTSVSAFSNEFVTEVRQNLHEKINSDLNGQMVAYQRASLVYTAYASYFDRGDVYLPGFRDFFLAASKAALNDSQKVIDYMNLRGGHQQFTNIEMKAACREMAVPEELKSEYPNHTPEICDYIMKKDPSKAKHKKKEVKQSTPENWQHGLMALIDSLCMERSLNTKLEKLTERAVLWDDKHLKHTVEDFFLAKQTVRIQKLAELITKLRQYSEQDYPLGEYIIDLEMGD